MTTYTPKTFTLTMPDQTDKFGGSPGPGNPPDGYVLTWDSFDGYYVARPPSSSSSTGNGYAAYNFTADVNVLLSPSIWAKQVIRFTDTGSVLSTMRIITIPSSPGDNRIIHNDTTHSLQFTNMAGSAIIPPESVRILDDRDGYITANTTIQINFVDPRDYGDCPGDSTTDCTAAIAAALTAAQTNTLNPLYPNYKTLQLPSGAMQITQPLRVNTSFTTIRGQSSQTSILRPNFQGPTIIIGADMSDLPAVLQNGPFSGPAFNLGQSRGYTIDLRRISCGEVNNASGLTVEATVKLTSDLSGDEHAIVAASSGQ